MKKCPNCNHNIEGFHVDCPNCGYQLLTPQQAQEALVMLDQIKDRMLNLDLTPEGITKSMQYIDNVTKFLQIYQNLLLSFMEEHKAVDSKRKKSGDKLGSMKAQSYLGLMNMLWFNPENTKFSLEVVASSPPGSFVVKNHLIALKDLTEVLAADYANFFEHKDSSGLEKSKKSIGEISEHLNTVWVEIERLNSQITDALKSSKK